jgi:predicted RNA-binding protein YlqC (UPF0109 family)
MKDTYGGSVAANLAMNLAGRIVREYTFHHDQLKIWPEKMGQIEIIYMQTHRADMPRVLGGQGKHRHALYNLVEQVGLRHSTELRLENVEPEVGDVERFKPFQAAVRWDSKPIVQLMRDICKSVFLYETHVSLTDSQHSATSNIQVVVSNEERMQTAVRMSESLKVLFNAIGKRHGRILLVDVVSQAVLAKQAAVK